MAVNYQKELEKKIEQLKKEKKIPKLLLHSCCAPCSSYCLEYLSQYFEITVFYYNPNIFPKEEYNIRVKEQKRLIDQMKFLHKVSFLEGEYEPDCFFHIAKGLEKEEEGGPRCLGCYRLRLQKAAEAALRTGSDYFTTTLSISPLKNAEKLNDIGRELGGSMGVEYLYSDFKKKNGYKRSVELSGEYQLYRQDFCGCIFSQNRQIIQKI